MLDELTALHSPMSPVMVVGARCRDALHVALGHNGPLRATNDLDLALAVSSWEQFETLTTGLTPIRASGSTIRYQVSGIPVDLVPFGPPVEDPDGTVSPPPREDTMSVFGFQDVYDTAPELQLAPGLAVRLPTIPGYALLKLKAWADRSPDGEYRDGGDLACALFWYQEFPEIRDRLYGDDPSDHGHIERTGWDEPLAAVRLLIADAVALVPEDRRRELIAAWPAADRDGLLARELARARVPGWPAVGDRRLSAYATAIREVLSGSGGRAMI